LDFSSGSRMDQFEDPPEQVTECDDWASRTVEISDSISAINEVTKEISVSTAGGQCANYQNWRETPKEEYR